LKKYVLPLILLILLGGLFSFQKLSQTPAPPKHTIVGFENYVMEQPDGITCGPTSATMLLHYYSKDVTLDEVKKEALTEWIRFKDGTNFGMTAPDALRVAIHKKGVEARVRRGNIGELKRYVSQNKPVIVLVRSSNTTWHYCVVVGYNEDEVMLADPGYGFIRAINTDRFINCWKFTHDMNGNKCNFECPACGGSGKYFGIIQCDICSGKGTLDPMVLALRAADIHSNTMIVPEKGESHEPIITK